jgi:hypothetical protein
LTEVEAPTQSLEREKSWNSNSKFFYIGQQTFLRVRTQNSWSLTLPNWNLTPRTKNLFDITG